MNKLEEKLRPLVEKGLKCVLIFGVPAKIAKVCQTKGEKQIDFLLFKVNICYFFNNTEIVITNDRSCHLDVMFLPIKTILKHIMRKVYCTFCTNMQKSRF